MHKEKKRKGKVGLVMATEGTQSDAWLGVWDFPVV